MSRTFIATIGLTVLTIACGGDMASPPASPSSAAPVQSVALPPSAQYDLALHPVSITQCSYTGQSATSYPTTAPQLADASATATLGTMSDHIQFGPLNSYDDLTLTATRAGNQFSGVLVGSIADAWTLEFEKGALVAGSIDSSGKLSGTATGLFLLHSGGLAVTECSSVFSLSLTLHL